MTLTGMSWLCYEKDGVIELAIYLASQRAEEECVQEASPADLAEMRDGLAAFRLRPLVEEQNPRAVYHIRLDSAYVQNLLNLRNPHHVVVRRSPYLRHCYHQHL